MLPATKITLGKNDPNRLTRKHLFKIRTTTHAHGVHAHRSHIHHSPAILHRMRSPLL